MARTNKTQEAMEEEIKNAFLTFDADGSGFIDREELVNVLTTMGDPVDEETINGMIAEADLDGDGKINYAEFTKVHPTCLTCLTPAWRPSDCPVCCRSCSSPKFLLFAFNLAWCPVSRPPVSVA